MDTVAKQQLIEQLKPVVNEPEFDSIFAALTNEMSGPDRFKLKGELRRLARPCKKAIDLRKRVDGHCRPYKHKGVLHYMDEVAIQIFEAGLDRYRGVFTEDTYEQVHNAENNYRVLAAREKKRAQAARDRIQAARERSQRGGVPQPAEEVAAAVSDIGHLEVPYFTFGRYFHRSEERMNFTVPVMLKAPDGKDVEAMTTNISVSGMRIKLPPGVEFNQGQQIGVRFTGLAQEFTFDPNLEVPYDVKAVDQDKGVQYLRLLRDVDFESSQFDAFMLRFINGYKRRYKVNIDNTYSALVIKGHEQFYFPRMRSLPLFFRRKEKRMFSAMALETQNNSFILDDWLNEENQIQLPSLFTGKRLTRYLKTLQNNSDGIASDLIFCFQVLREGKVYFYSATDSELADPELRRIFLGFASRTSSFKVYRFNFSVLDAGKAWLPVTLPKEILEREKHLQRPPAPDVMQQLGGLTHVGLLSDITPTVKNYQHYECSREELTALKDFMVSHKLPSELQRVSYDFVNFRSESRFGYRTQARVRVGDKSTLGSTRDISTMGLQIDIEESLKVKPGDYVEIDLPQLNRRRKEHDLKGLRYEVMNVSSDANTLHLRVDVNVSSHAGRDFIAEMIESNLDELLATRQSVSLHGLQLCLRNLYSHSMMSFPLYLHRPKGGEFSIGQVGVSSLNEVMKQLCLGLSKDSKKVSMRPLLDEAVLQQEIKRHWLRLDNQSRPMLLTLFTFIRRKGNDFKIVRRFAHEFKSTSVEQAFVRNGMEQGVVLAMRLEISRTGKPDISFIANEFKYVNLYAAHKAKQLEQDLWSVAGMVDVINCSDELFTRFNLEPELREQQAQRLDDLLAEM
ncbi:hypothetical protein CWE09_05810 [Aliidiomarina minuta]|uniref:PilZ domain-containing protein n=1 Tax=Aliidiomarina minuta TaxID=880057 RepID=A0A432W800_9GAMM|nr:PilZ domain-containing protein [Aliidiomarina minuta]RUO26230.1 hypothetical protein CWE09_05810 [Aliidiomarina minuta]